MWGSTVRQVDVVSSRVAIRLPGDMLDERTVDIVLALMPKYSILGGHKTSVVNVHDKVSASFSKFKIIVIIVKKYT